MQILSEILISTQNLIVGSILGPVICLQVYLQA